jgi:hypothetical protein
MPSITLSKTETRLLTEAAGREDGLVILPTAMKATTAERLLGKLTNDGLITSHEQDGAVGHHLTPAGYRAIGKPPRRPRAVAEGSNQAQADKPGTKRSLILDLLGRGRGRASRS